VAGFCGTGKQLPLPVNVEVEVTVTSKDNGINASFDEAPIHCLAAEPHSVVLRVCVADGRHEAAYETAILGRLHEGYRIFHLRSFLGGTRIELCYLFVRIQVGMEPNLWITPRQLHRRKTIGPVC